MHCIANVHRGIFAACGCLRYVRRLTDLIREKPQTRNSGLRYLAPESLRAPKYESAPHSCRAPDIYMLLVDLAIKVYITS
jgi:hypothetical protein